MTWSELHGRLLAAPTLSISWGDVWHQVWTKAASIAVVLVVAVIARWLLHKFVDRTVTSVRRGAERAGRLRPSALGEADELSRREQRAQAISSVLKSVVTFWVYGLAAVYVLHALGVNLGPIIASAGVIGIAVGFGAQTLVKDFLSGVFMILEDQYGVGDTIDVGTARGTVERMTLRVTQVRDLNGTLWHIRNGSIDRVGNMSQGWSQAVVDVPVAPGEDVDRAESVIASVAREMREDPDWAASIGEDAEILGVQELHSDRMLIRANVRTAPERQGPVAREMRRRIAAEFEHQGIRMWAPPFTPVGADVAGSAAGAAAAAAAASGPAATGTKAAEPASGGAQPTETASSVSAAGPTAAGPTAAGPTAAGPTAAGPTAAPPTGPQVRPSPDRDEEG